MKPDKPENRKMNSFNVFWGIWTQKPGALDYLIDKKPWKMRGKILLLGLLMLVLFISGCCCCCFPSEEEQQPIVTDKPSEERRTTTPITTATTTTTTIATTTTTIATTTTTIATTTTTIATTTTTEATTTTTIPEIECYVKRDCGTSGYDFTKNSSCVGSEIRHYSVEYNCLHPGTPEAECIGTSTTSTRRCPIETHCIDGENYCVTNYITCDDNVNYCTYVNPKIDYNKRLFTLGLRGTISAREGSLHSGGPIFVGITERPAGYTDFFTTNTEYQRYRGRFIKYYIKLKNVLFDNPNNGSYSGYYGLALLIQEDGSEPTEVVVVVGNETDSYNNQLNIQSRIVYSNSTDIIAEMYLKEGSPERPERRIIINVTKDSEVSIDEGYTFTLERLVYVERMGQPNSEIDYIIINVKKPDGSIIKLSTGPEQIDFIDDLQISFWYIRDDEVVQLIIT